MTKMELAGW